MKKDKQNNRKAIRKEIKLSLTAKLKEVITTMIPEPQNIGKEIKKPINKLAKKIAKGLETARKSDVKFDEKQKVKPAAQPQKVKNQPEPNLPSPPNNHTTNRKTAAGLSKSKPVKQ